MEEIKVGDKVRVREDAPKVYQKGSVFDYTEHQSTVHELDGDAAIIGLDIEDSRVQKPYMAHKAILVAIYDCCFPISLHVDTSPRLGTSVR